MFGSSNYNAIKKALAACKAVAAGDFEARVIGITEKGEAKELLTTNCVICSLGVFRKVTIIDLPY